MPFWVTFHDGSGACVELLNDERPAVPKRVEGQTHEERREVLENYSADLDAKVASKVADLVKDKQVATIQVLPYPASPQIGTTSGCPAFCWSPKECAGHGACPKNYACSE